MEIMENNKYTPELVCKESITYNIPIYQRLFTWDKENVKQLLDDLRDQFLKSSDSPYYIGMLTKHGNDLVDGQQRFTVLSLMASVFQKEYSPWTNMKGKLFLSARKDDADYLESLFSNSPRADVENKKMFQGRNAILEWINENKKINIDKYAEYVFKKCTFFIASLPSDYRAQDLNKYFEAMNSTGKNLESHEIVKVVRYLKSMTSDQDLYNSIWNVVADIDKPLIRKRTYERETEEKFRNRYRSAIYSFDDLFPERIDINDFNRTEDNLKGDDLTIRQLEANGNNPDVRRQDRYYGEGYHSMLTFPEFFLLILYILLPEEEQKDVNVNEFFDTHKLQTTVDTYTDKWMETDWQIFGRKMLRYRLIFDYFVIRIPNSETGDYNLDYSEDVEGMIDSSVLTQIQSMLYVDSSSKTYYRWVVPFLLFLSENEDASSMEIFNELQKIDNGIDEHSASFLDDESSYSFGGRRTVYFLRRLDFYLWLDNHLLKNTNDERYTVINNFRFKRGINSQEHLHPQHDEGRDGYEKWGEDKNKFGNLFLISSSFNLSQSDDTINTKFGRIKDQIKYSRIESIKLYYIWDLCNEEEKEWTIDNMKKHQKEMIQRLVNSY